MTRRRTHGTEDRMAYDEGLAQRLREALAHENGLTERRMFGGIAFMLDGNMAVGVSSDELMVRSRPGPIRRGAGAALRRASSI